MSTKKIIGTSIIALAAVLTTGMFSGCSKGKIIEAAIDKVVTESKIMCPRQVDEITRLDSITHPGKATIEYFYTLNMSKDDLDQEVLEAGEKTMEQTIINQIKTSSQLKPLLSLGNVTFHHIYFDKNGKTVFDINITPDMYK
ncbi:MAG: hypothetical protein FWF54_10510 [Candidatus Azobacteroides sp.]|jgi:hypothetical protein|nr:hypothetical protein [Candidatus Azobacteroides sp.]